MIKFNKPTNLNGTELIAEIKEAAVEINNVPIVDENGDLWLDIKAADETKVKSIVSKHNGTIIAPQPSVQDKLASVGLSIDDLKVALGL